MEAFSFERRITTPSEINRRVKQLIEGEIDELWVRGEISNFTRAASGHLYFSLKDSTAQIRGVMWKGNAQRLRFQPADGVEVEIRGKLSVYEPRGEYQLNAAEMSPAGLGALYMALEALKRKLAAEGLFDQGRKRQFPAFPIVVGLVTSPGGAAVRDLIRVARRRWPSVRLVLAPTRVQGEGSAVEIAAAIELMNRWGQADVLIIGRGGGSMEDLWAFNEEIVVRAIAGSRIPTVSAVGHEVDVTLSDLAADVRAATPSNAAELVVPDAREWSERIERLNRQLNRAVVDGLTIRRRRIESITATHGFKRPRDFLTQEAQRVDDLARRLALGTERRLIDARRRASDLDRRRQPALRNLLTRSRARLDRLSAQLGSLDSTAVLSRGYALVLRADGSSVVTTAGDLRPEDRLMLQFALDRAAVRVESTIPGGPGDI
ncbi:MAG: exodeoxyribonuclease VII large subunit [Candidatus Eisenbacteria bacterium]|nr:exodeoxyribonuclease VII large subunit [Candidatus Eisenbacteria bacterium]